MSYANCVLGLLWAASTAVTAANVTNASFKSSPVPLQTTLLTCEPSESASKETTAVLDSCLRNYGPPCTLAPLRPAALFSQGDTHVVVAHTEKRECPALPDV